MANKLRFLMLFLVVLIAFGLTNTTQAVEQLRENTDDLDRMYWGEDLPRNNAKVLKRYRKAAESGAVEFMFNLGSMYHSGQGVPQDYVEALKWFRKAAEQGFASAQFNLGLMYVRGEGVQKNNSEAYAWWSIAAANGHEIAEKGRDAISEVLFPEALAAARQRATELIEEIEARKNVQD